MQCYNKKSLWKWVLIGFIIITIYYLLVEHRVHVISLLPFLLFLACPLMHLFMHKNHGSHGGNSCNHDNKNSNNDNKRQNTQ